MKRNYLSAIFYASFIILCSCGGVEDVTKQKNVTSMEKDNYPTDSYIQKKPSQTLKQLKNPDYLDQIRKLNNFQKTNKNDLSDSILIRVVNKADFLEKKQSAVKGKFFDNLKETKQGVEISCKYKKVLIQNKDFDDVESDVRKIHTFVKFIHEINAVVINASYYEGEEFFLYDLDACDKIAVFGGDPLFFSNNYIISIFEDAYDEETSSGGRLEVAEFIPNQKLVKTLYETGWTIPSEYEKEIAPFMSIDGYYYFPVMDASNLWDENGNYNTNYQYAKLKIN